MDPLICPKSPRVICHFSVVYRIKGCSTSGKAKAGPCEDASQRGGKAGMTGLEGSRGSVREPLAASKKNNIRNPGSKVLTRPRKVRILSLMGGGKRGHRYCLWSREFTAGRG